MTLSCCFLSLTPALLMALSTSVASLRPHSTLVQNKRRNDRVALWVGYMRMCTRWWPMLQRLRVTIAPLFKLVSPHGCNKGLQVPMEIFLPNPANSSCS
ncbi:hypothetical protein HDV63DRAFT_114023 [Trichoderma sp. SZMC 28014]